MSDGSTAWPAQDSGWRAELFTLFKQQSPSGRSTRAMNAERTGLEQAKIDPLTPAPRACVRGSLGTIFARASMARKNLENNWERVRSLPDSLPHFVQGSPASAKATRVVRHFRGMREPTAGGRLPVFWPKIHWRSAPDGGIHAWPRRTRKPLPRLGETAGPKPAVRA